MACGDRYKFLAITASGYTPDNPWGVVLLPFTDYAEWKVTTDSIIHLVNKHLIELQRIEAARGGTFLKWIPLANERTDLIRRYDELPSIVGSGTMHDKEPIAMALDVVAEGLCLLEKTDDAIASYGQTPPPVPGVRPVPKEKPELPALQDIPWPIYAVGGVLVAAAAYGIYRRARG